METYDIITKIGNGACGAVYLVRHLETKRLYALKKIQLDEKRKNRTREAVLREAKILAGLKHPNIVAYHDSFFDELDENLCIIQDYCDGGTLDEVISEAARKKSYFPKKQIFEWFIQLTMALHYIHSKKILYYRDIKTQNVFLTKKKICKIGDFGISKMMDQTVDMAKTCVGTPCYLAPEMCQDIPYSSKADVWALGCLLYEMCALRPAFDANNLISLFYKIIRGDYEPIPSQYSKCLGELIKVILVKNPDERPSARQVLIHPSTAEMLSDFIEEKQYQLEQITQIRASPSNFDDRCCASKNSHTPKASMLSSCETNHSPVLHGVTAIKSNGHKSDVTKRHYLDLPDKALLQKPASNCSKSARGTFTDFNSEKEQLSTFNAISADTEKIDLKVIDDKQRIEADTVDYEDDFDEEIDDEIQVKQDSDEEIPEELPDDHEAYDSDTTDDSVVMTDEVAADEDEYVDDFEEDEEELEDLVSHAREIQEFKHTSSGNEDETVIDEMVSSVITSCKKYLKQHCLTSSKKNQMIPDRKKLSDITEEDLNGQEHLTNSLELLNRDPINYELGKRHRNADSSTTAPFSISQTRLHRKEAVLFSVCINAPRVRYRHAFLLSSLAAADSQQAAILWEN
ncbi:hypothetical protein LSH36_1062g00012 [Paralvinella palmiformis]|uniref:non-specific serine/threonine protein kinase n=1 Tax=Paralvinella palmiformis TaxID=53620 RepID=A0AAD9IVF9_9ANNE|nr:hypothetical protein LSH36_1062g00012 [Paralvinella palmiformis]